MFFKKVLTEDFVELSVGRVYFKPINHGLENKIRIKSTIFKGAINNTLFFTLFEYAIVDLSKRKIDKLSIPDGTKLRLKLKEILLRYGILEKEASTDSSWSNPDKDWFNEAKKKGLSKARGG